jgi:lysophospholipid acyltransferase (LPLAT)-like uncharacterized protein
VSEARYRAAGLLGRVVLGALFTTVRYSSEGDESYRRFRRQGTPVIFVIWHGQLLPLAYRHRGQGVVALVSEHRDGEYATRLLEQIGFGTVRGSSTRGGIQGLKGLIRAAREGHDLTITVDGPLGPAREFKPGALVAAQSAGIPIVPVGMACSRAWRLDSWDRFMVPQPISTVRVAYGEPRWIERETDREGLAAAALGLGREMDALTARCEAALGGTRRGAAGRGAESSTRAP